MPLRSTRGDCFDRGNKPDWFLAVSPLGKTPVLQVGDKAIFESAVILEYLEETQPNPLHPADPLARADHRAWIEFGSAVLGDIWGLETAKDETAFRRKAVALEQKFARLELRLGGQPWFDDEKFSLVDAVFAPAFRYFDVIDRIGDFGVFTGKPKIERWRKNLASRASVRDAVGDNYASLLRDFMMKHDAYLIKLEDGTAA